MAEYKVYQVDSFAERIFGGNPAGVVLGADGLSERQMQQIARELNDSETAFVLGPEDGSHDIRVRFFTPAVEVPLCGHATVAANYVRAAEGLAGPGLVRMKTGVGILPITVVSEDGGFRIVMGQGKPGFTMLSEDPALRDEICQALGIESSDLRPDCPICAVSVGNPFIMVGLKSLETLHGLKPDQQALLDISLKTGTSGFYPFTLHPEQDALVHSRLFAPSLGIAEDPVTGTAGGPIGAYLTRFRPMKGVPEEGLFSFTVCQGEAMGRAGSLTVSVTVRDKEAADVSIAGRAVIAFKTEISL